MPDQQDMSHELLIALGALLIIIIFIDGVRRVRRSGYDRIRVSRRKQPIFDDGGDDFGSELPSGGARVVGVRADEEAKQLQEEIRKSAEQNKPRLCFAKDQPESAGQAAQRESSREHPQAARRSSGKQPRQATLELDQPGSGRRAPQEVMVFHLRAGKGGVYNGQALLEVLVEEGMRYGDMDIFHRHAENDGSGDVLFSMANSVKPGTFDLNTIDRMETPCVSFFIDLGAVDEPSDAFGKMLNTIAGCMEKLGGELKDETRSDVTRQTIEHYWQRVRDFERRGFV